MAGQQSSQTCQTEVPKIALGIAAHPDDLDFGSAGTVATWAAQGAEIYYLVLTNGNKGSADHSADPKLLTELRRQEQREAARILGVRDVFFCDYEDGCLAVDMDVKRDIVRVIRQVRPEAVICMDPTMVYDVARGFINHPDHRAAGQAALDAVYPLARDHLSLPELYKDEGLEPHKVSSIYMTNFSNQNCFIDITNNFDIKMRALAAHGSQIPDLMAAKRLMHDFAAKTGKKCGAVFAEGFLRIDVH